MKTPIIGYTVEAEFGQLTVRQRKLAECRDGRLAGVGGSDCGSHVTTP
jgi:hypothetical protein